MKKNKFKVQKRKVMYSKGPIHLVDCDVRMANGKTLSRQIIEHPGSVVIIPVNDKKEIALIRQFRFATGTWMWEFPAGGIEPGENLAAAAKRECAEEIGYYPRKLRKLISFYPTPGISGELMHLYLAENLVYGPQEQDEDEEIEVQYFSRAKIEKMIDQGQITDAKTLLGYAWLMHFGFKEKRAE